MRVIRSPFGVVVALIAAVILQTTFFGRVRLAGLAPDIVMVVVILSTFRLRGEVALGVGFVGGLVFDVLSSNALGLRALVYTAVAYVALRTRDRADFGPVAVALWVGLVSLFGVALLLVLGTLFGQFGLSGGEAMRRLILVPIFNFVTALVLSPVSVRLMGVTRRGLL
jgi:rod shape-determining protein MreD